MFVGHLAVAFGAKKLSPQVSLGTLFLACQLADLLWPNLILLGIESFRVVPGDTLMTPLSFDEYPYSRNLLTLLAVAYLGLHRGGSRAAIVVAWSAQAIWLVVIWGYWVDRHRRRS